jgi:hypothetical protein
MAYHPQEDQYLVIQLPNERLRAMIRRVVTDDAVIVEITSVPLSRTHNYKKGDYVACRREKSDLGEAWASVAEQRISIDDLAQSVEQPKKESAKKKTAKKPVKKVKKNAIKIRK